MQPQVLRHPQAFLAVVRGAALLGLAVGQAALPAAVLYPAIVYVLAASLLALLESKRSSSGTGLVGTVAALDVVWFTIAWLHVQPVDFILPACFTAIVTALVAGASSGMAVGVSLLSAVTYYAVSIAAWDAQPSSATPPVLGYHAAMIALAGTLSGYFSGQVMQLRRSRAMVERLGKLNAATAEMTAVASDAELIRGALTHAAEIIGADRLWVMLADHEGHTLRLDGHIGASPGSATATECKEDEGIAGRVVRTRASVVLTGSAGRRPGLTPLESGFAAEHLLAVPISDNGSVGGVLLLSRCADPAFSDADLALLTMLGRFVGRALHTARLIRRLHQAASTDSLTGLYNHETFLTKLAEKVAHAAETGKPVSLIVLDMDGFKRVNDTAGHWAGDRVLKALADTLRQECRSADIIGRYGGDEFAVVLPETGREEAAVIARRAAQALRVVGEDLDLPVPVTASWGVAAFPGDGSNDEQIFRRADARLYEAKDAGGDRVTFDSAVA
jgi:diguanylate cyclase (GGDEF)-like protein